MSKILQMKMNNNRYYYKQGQSSKVPYLLVLIIFVLLYIMNGLHEDSKDANKMFEKVIHEFPKNNNVNKDSLKLKYDKKIDSLIGVIDWYKNQYKNQYKKTNNKITKEIKKEETIKKDTI